MTESSETVKIPAIRAFIKIISGYKFQRRNFGRMATLSQFILCSESQKPKWFLISFRLRMKMSKFSC